MVAGQSIETEELYYSTRLKIKKRKVYLYEIILYLKIRKQIIFFSRSYNFFWLFSTDDHLKQQIQLGIAEYHKYTCLRIVPRTNQKDYIRIRRPAEGLVCYINMNMFSKYIACFS